MSEQISYIGFPTIINSKFTSAINRLSTVTAARISNIAGLAYSIYEQTAWRTWLCGASLGRHVMANSLGPLIQRIPTLHSGTPDSLSLNCKLWLNHQPAAYAASTSATLMSISARSSAETALPRKVPLTGADSSGSPAAAMATWRSVTASPTLGS